jgi:hypothetical protein
MVPYGIMAQIAQKRLYFTFAAGSEDAKNDISDIYLDIPAALSAVNRKQYHQVTASGDPLCYTVTVKAIASTKVLTFTTAANTWTTRNAVKKVAVGWKEQMKNSGIRMSELPTYARRFRCALDIGGHTSAANTQTLLNHMVPDDAGGKRLFTPYEGQDPAAADITYFNSNEIVMLSIASDANPDEAYRCALLGATDATNTSFGMIYEYLKSRRNMRSRSDPDVEFPDDDGLLNTIFATSESLADDVTEAVDDYNIARPYSELGNVGAVPERDDACQAIVGAIVQPSVANFSETFSAPLGLIKMDGFGLAADDMFIVDVEAVYEM